MLPAEGVFGIPEIAPELAEAYGTIEQGAMYGWDSQRMYAEIRNAIGVGPDDKLPFSVQQVNQLWSSAIDVRESMNSLGQALSDYGASGLDQPIMSDYIAQPWWSASGGMIGPESDVEIKVSFQRLNPEWQAGVEGADQYISEWRTILPARTPRSLSELEQYIEAGRKRMTGRYEWEITGYDAVSVQAV